MICDILSFIDRKTLLTHFSLNMTVMLNKSIIAHIYFNTYMSTCMFTCMNVHLREYTLDVYKMTSVVTEVSHYVNSVYTN